MNELMMAFYGAIILGSIWLGFGSIREFLSFITSINDLKSGLKLLMMVTTYLIVIHDCYTYFRTRDNTKETSFTAYLIQFLSVILLGFLVYVAEKANVLAWFIWGFFYIVAGIIDNEIAPNTSDKHSTEIKQICHLICALVYLMLNVIFNVESLIFDLIYFMLTIILVVGLWIKFDKRITTER